MHNVHRCIGKAKPFGDVRDLEADITRGVARLDGNCPTESDVTICASGGTGPTKCSSLRIQQLQTGRPRTEIQPTEFYAGKLLGHLQYPDSCHQQQDFGNEHITLDGLNWSRKAREVDDIPMAGACAQINNLAFMRVVIKQLINWGIVIGSEDHAKQDMLSFLPLDTEIAFF
jgi:hypothetical protein